MAALQESCFVVLAGPYAVERPGVVADAYDAEVGSAVGDDIRVESTSTRVVDFVNRGPLFDPLYVYPPLLGVAARIVGRSFKLSSLNARTLRPGTAMLDIHVDLERDSTDWLLLAFILMITFAPDNGATRFIPGSQLRGVLLQTTIALGIAPAGPKPPGQLDRRAIHGQPSRAGVARSTNLVPRDSTCIARMGSKLVHR
jgi:hypothetical protein